MVENRWCDDEFFEFSCEFQYSVLSYFVIVIIQFLII